MLLPPDRVGRVIMFPSVAFVFPSVCLFVRADIVTVIFHECIEKFGKIDWEYSSLSTDDLIRF